ncbi:aldo/keto reductase [Paenibacillus sp. GCM10023252]|uniref:aldo/keto reductase n=1 Tax=Paenibacillus sp. GCM10023252 TaxID=3252649 RepID=UPI0036083D5D
MEYTILGKTGFRVSQLGLGGAPLGGDFSDGVTDEQVTEVVHRSLDLGINFIDTAPLYGRGESERRIGEALKGGKRESVILASKAVMRGEAYNYENTIRSVENSLKRLQTDVIDLLQIHEPDSWNFDEVMNGCYLALVKLKEQGKIRAIGVNGRDFDVLLPYLQTRVFDTTQVFSRYMLIDHSAKDKVFPLTRELNMGVINGSVLGMGLLADAPAKFINQSMIDLAEERKAKLAFLRKTEPKGLIEPAMRFSYSCPDIHVTLTGTTSIRSLERNASYCDGKGLPREDLDCIFAAFPSDPIDYRN